MADLTPSQRTDVNKRLGEEATARQKALTAPPPGTPVAAQPNTTLGDLAKLTESLRLLASKPTVQFSGNIGTNVSLAAAYQQSSFWARGAGG